MSVVAHVIEQEELFTNSLGVEIFSNIVEKETIRKQLQEDIDLFLSNGGSIFVAEPEPFLPHYKKVGNFKDGLTGAFHGLSRESL